MIRTPPTWPVLREQYARMCAALGEKEVARRLSVRLSTVYRWRNGERTPRGLSLAALDDVIEAWLVSVSFRQCERLT